ncbi:MAG TPA: nicotinate (nicotinamide) nucleotide adenylyltransferase [Crinalium sp.]|jgi:nicotinate-nucleotide adenylyltransferase
MAKLAILGGTFNPIHWGHLLMAEAALDQYGLDRVIWVPSYHPPHRSPLDLVDIAHRLAMVRLAIRDHPAFVLSTVEGKRQGMSYAIHTLTDLSQEYPNSEWYWIIGLDAFQSLPRWYRRHDLAAQCRWLVAPRWEKSAGGDRYPPPEAESAKADSAKVVAQQMTEQGIELCWHPLTMPRIEISSSLIRQYCGDRRSIRYLVPDAVLDYITAHNLYDAQAHNQCPHH